MKKLFGLAFAASLALLPALRASAMTNEEAGEKAMGLMEGIASIMDSDKANCDKMAADLSKFADDNAALFKELNAMKAKQTDADKKAWRDKYQERMKAVTQKMMPGGQACQSNEKFKAAIGKMRWSER